jgi:hypothetical protein
MGYDDSMYGDEQMVVSYIPYMTESANEVLLRLQFFTNVKLLNIKCQPVGTAFTTTNTLNVYNDDAHIGEVVCPEAVTTSSDISGLSTLTEINSTSSLEIQQGTAASIGNMHLLISYQEVFEGL